jgi:lauroyl/myristoyl acyltransferase
MFFFVTLVRIRRGIASNLDVVLGPSSYWGRLRRAFRTLWEFSWCLTERYENLTCTRTMRFEIEGERYWQEVTNGSRGFIMLTAHVGHWESGAALPASEFSRTVHLVREKEVDPRAQDFIRNLIEGRAHGQRFRVHFADDQDPSLGPTLLFALRNGDIVALQGDRPRTAGRSIELKLFDRPFSLPYGPVALARAAEVPILPVFVFREGRLRARIVFRKPIDVDRTVDREADFEGAMRKAASELEWAIRMHPHQWFCFRGLWPLHL